jgi:metallo-beta-lactamase family protein
MAGSGMSNGGRILHHEMRYLPDPKSTIVFVGYQAEGSMGRQLLEGANEVTIFGEKIPVLAKRVNIPGYSAHADQPHLLAWLSSMAKPVQATDASGAPEHALKKVFVVQGEQASSETLAGKITEQYGVAAEVPKLGETVTL